MKELTIKQIAQLDMEKYFEYLIPEDSSFIVNKKARIEQDRFDRVYLDAILIEN